MSVRRRNRPKADEPSVHVDVEGRSGPDDAQDVIGRIRGVGQRHLQRRDAGRDSGEQARAQLAVEPAANRYGNELHVGGAGPSSHRAGGVIDAGKLAEDRRGRIETVACTAKVRRAASAAAIYTVVAVVAVIPVVTVISVIPIVTVISVIATIPADIDIVIDQSTAAANADI